MSDSSPPTLWSRLPQEIFLLIVGCLDVESLKALRLVDRTFSQRCLGPHFNIRQPSIDLTHQNFESLEALIRNPILRQQVHHITVVALYFAVREAEESLVPSLFPRYKWKTGDIRCDIRWLREQRNAQQDVSLESVVKRLAHSFAQFENLNSVELDAAVQLAPHLRVDTEESAWPEVWTMAIKVHWIVIAALTESKVSLSQLNIYRDIVRCSLFLEDHALQLAELDQPKRDVLCANLHTLKLSLCSEMSINTLEHGLNLPKGTEIVDRSFRSVVKLPRRASFETTPRESLGIVQLLKSTPKLRHLDLHFYSMSFDNSDHDWILTAIAQQIRLPELEAISLAGFPATLDAIFSLLARHCRTIKHIAPENIILTSGKWKQIFELMDTKMPRLEHVHFATLKETVQTRYRKSQKIVNLQAPWDVSSPCVWTQYLPLDGGDWYPRSRTENVLHRRSFNKDQLRNGLKFQTASTSAVTSREIRTWLSHLRNVYGPPVFSLIHELHREVADQSDNIA